MHQARNSERVKRFCPCKKQRSCTTPVGWFETGERRNVHPIVYMRKPLLFFPSPGSVKKCICALNFATLCPCLMSGCRGPGRPATTPPPREGGLTCMGRRVVLQNNKRETLKPGKGFSSFFLLFFFPVEGLRHQPREIFRKEKETTSPTRPGELVARLSKFWLGRNDSRLEGNVGFLHGGAVCPVLFDTGALALVAGFGVKMKDDPSRRLLRGVWISGAGGNRVRNG